MKLLRVIGFSLFLAAWFAASPLYAQNDLQAVPVAQGFLADAAGVLPPEERNRISALLRKLNQEKGSQLGVVIVNATEPEAIEDFAQRVFTTWKLGRKGVGDGVLLMLAPDNKVRRMRIHVGYGMEGTITDAVAKRILADQMRPALEKSGPAAAINIGVDELLARMYKADVAAKQQTVNVVGGAAIFRLVLGTLAQIPLYAFAAYL